MCFVACDYDWTASVVVDTDEPAKKKTHCDECGADIQVGEMLHHKSFQEHEECRVCHPDGEESPPDLEEHEHEFGETSDYDRCDSCDKFLQAVEAAELEAGCSKYDSRPNLAYMIEDIRNGDMDDAKRYWKKAVVMFSELKASGYLAKLWQVCF